MSEEKRPWGWWDGPMSEEARELAASNLRLVYKFASLMKRRFYGIDEEIDSAAMLGLCKAARAFDPGRGVKFSVLAYRCMDREVRGAWRAFRKSRYVCFSSFETNPDFPDPRTAREEGSREREAKAAEVRAGISSLHFRDRFVLERMDLQGMTGKEVGVELAKAEGKPAPISKSRIGQLAERARARLARQMQRGRSG